MIDATKKWIFLKISAATLVPLMLWFIINHNIRGTNVAPLIFKKIHFFVAFIILKKIFSNQIKDNS